MWISPLLKIVPEQWLHICCDVGINAAALVQHSCLCLCQPCPNLWNCKDLHLNVSNSICICKIMFWQHKFEMISKDKSFSVWVNRPFNVLNTSSTEWGFGQTHQRCFYLLVRMVIVMFCVCCVNPKPDDKHNLLLPLHINTFQPACSSSSYRGHFGFTPLIIQGI